MDTTTNNATEPPVKEQEQAILDCFLVESGIEENQWDPSSLEALRDILNGKPPSSLRDDDENEPTTRTTTTMSSKRGKRIRENALTKEEEEKETNENKATTPAVSSTTAAATIKRLELFSNKEEEDTKKSPIPTTCTQKKEPFEIPKEATPTEQLILKQLQHQTLLIQDLSERLDDHIRKTKIPQDASATRFLQAANAMGLPPPPRAAARAAAAPAVVPPPARNNNPRGVFFPVELYNRWLHFTRGLMALQQAQPRPPTFWTLLKIICMVSVVLSRHEKAAVYTVPVICIFVSTFLVWQVVKSCGVVEWGRYAYRVLLQGERIPDFVQDHRQRRVEVVQAAVPRDAAGGMWHALVAHGDRPLPTLLQYLLDILIVLGSFVCSIFPMWEPPRQQEQVARQEQPAAPNNNDGIVIPPVQAPVDPAAVDEEEEEPQAND